MATIYPTAAAAIIAAKRPSAAPLEFNATAHMLTRFGFGPKPADWTSRNGQDPDKWWADQVSLAKSAATAPYQQVPEIAALGPLLDKSAKQVQDYLTGQGRRYAWDAMEQLASVTLGLQLRSSAQMFESLVEVFSNHLNVTNRTGDMWDVRHVFDRDVIRRNVTGSFSSMLLASVRNVAMLKYLSQTESSYSKLNENLGRELLELHTVGTIYSEQDVLNSARILTGRSLDYVTDEYVYRPERHFVGKVAVLGFSHANSSAAGGEAVQEAYIRYLATHPSTAQMLARKLCTYYVSDTPSQSLVNQIASVYLKSNTQILPMVQAIFCSDEFWASRGAKARRPSQNAVAMFRALNIRTSDLAWTMNTLRYILGLINSAPLEAIPPTGYKWTVDAWHSASASARMWRLHRDVLCGRWKGLETPDSTALLGSVTPATVGDAIDAVSNRLVGQTLATKDRNILLSFVGEPATKKYSGSLAERSLGGLAVLIFDSPYFAMC